MMTITDFVARGPGFYVHRPTNERWSKAGVNPCLPRQTDGIRASDWLDREY
jgi:hypothetical protein